MLSDIRLAELAVTKDEEAGDLAREILALRKDNARWITRVKLLEARLEMIREVVDYLKKGDD